MCLYQVYLLVKFLCCMCFYLLCLQYFIYVCCIFCFIFYVCNFFNNSFVFWLFFDFDLELLFLFFDLGFIFFVVVLVVVVVCLRVFFFDLRSLRSFFFDEKFGVLSKFNIVNEFGLSVYCMMWFFMIGQRMLVKLRGGLIFLMVFVFLLNCLLVMRVLYSLFL